MIAALWEAGYNGVIFTPEPRGGKWAHDYDTQVEWEKAHLILADIIIAWVPRDLETLPAFTTNVEFGTWIDSGKIVYGRPDGSPKNKYLDWLYADRGHGKPHKTMQSLAEAVVPMLPDRDPKTEGWRQEGDRFIPLHVWKNKSFQEWLNRHRGEGNHIVYAKVLWRRKDITVIRVEMSICDLNFNIEPFNIVVSKSLTKVNSLEIYE